MKVEINYATSPNKILKKFRDAELILTSTFHGVILALRENSEFIFCEKESLIYRLSFLINELKLKKSFISYILRTITIWARGHLSVMTIR